MNRPFHLPHGTGASPPHRGHYLDRFTKFEGAADYFRRAARLGATAAEVDVAFNLLKLLERVGLASSINDFMSTKEPKQLQTKI